MLRHRQVAASPVRSASANLGGRSADLVADTIAQLARAGPRADAEQACPSPHRWGTMLVATVTWRGTRSPWSLGKVHCEITTVSGTAALTPRRTATPSPVLRAPTATPSTSPSPEAAQD